MDSAPGTADASPVRPGSLADPLTEYLVDSWQRTILFLDVLRQRGNQHFEHIARKAPNVLTFEPEVVLDGRTFDRPVNYLLTHILPPAGVTTDPSKRPFIVFDPRAGHGPGIGGMKNESEIGIALRQGHPCYFVGFLPEPCPGQTIEDVCRAEARFIEEVGRRHPHAQGKPALIGNCQAGWQIMMMAAVRPDVTGPIMLAGAPLSYWAGTRGKTRMRYLGGLLGGAWLASLAGDVGGGIFDGANLVANFESMHLSNTYWKKPYDVYDNEGEATRFLAFERWWGSPVLLNAGEMEYIVQELFVGNKLSTGGIRTSDGTRIELRNITAPIIVFCSWGDDITPPQQALDWILDLYNDEAEIVRAGQTIVYCLHQSIGHLGIFVSGKVAVKEHSEFIAAMDMIDMMPPGLYEAVITDVDGTTAHSGLMDCPYLFRLQARKLDDIRALGVDSAADEARFATVARVSEINEGLYRTLLQGPVRLSITPAAAELVRRTHPHRIRFEVFSDRNPWMQQIAALAPLVRAERCQAAADNPFRQLEHLASTAIIGWLDSVTEWRDSCVEAVFTGVYGSPLLQAAVGLTGENNPVRHAERDLAREAAATSAERRLEGRLSEGGIVDATVRAMLYVIWPKRTVDERDFATLLRLARQLPPAVRVGEGRFKEIVREQFLALFFDEARAVRTLPALLPEDRKQRVAALDVIRDVVGASGDLPKEAAERLRQVEAAFDPPSAKAARPQAA